MSLIDQFQSRKTFFVQLDDDQMRENRRQLSKQIFQLAYFGKISPEYASSLEIEERQYMYELLVEQLEGEKKKHEEEAKKVKSQTNKVKQAPRARR